MDNSKNDWTKKFSRKELSKDSYTLIHNIISSIFYKNIKLLTLYSLTKNEIGLLFHWSLYLSTNTFIERLIRTINNQKAIKKKINTKLTCYTYYTSLENITVNYYNNCNLNFHLTSDIKDILSNKKSKKENYSYLEPNRPSNEFIKNILSKNYTLNNLCNFFKRKFSQIDLSKENNIDYLFDGSKCLNIIFEQKNKIKKLNHKVYEIDNISRSKFRECFYNEFNKFLNNSFLKSLIVEKETKKNLSHLFSFWVDCSFSLSIVEGLRDRINFYSQYTNKYHLKYIHSSTGFLFNENIKVLSILAKRKKAKLVGHEHGINNFIDYYPLESSMPNFYKGLNQILYGDIYFSWGHGKLPDCWDNVEVNTKTKIYNFGSVYLGGLNKIKNNNLINLNEINILYISSAYRKYSTNLEEITPEENFIHKINVSNFLKELLSKYKNLKITYKLFMGTNLKQDPTINNLQDFIKSKRLKITKKEPVQIMKKFNLILFDMISTGFAEAINLEVPVLIFSHKFYYLQASKDGKNINNKLEDHGILFYDIKSGIKSFNNFLNDNNKFIKLSDKVLQKFKLMNSYPISKKYFLEQINKVL